MVTLCLRHRRFWRLSINLCFGISGRCKSAMRKPQHHAKPDCGRVARSTTHLPSLPGSKTRNQAIVSIAILAAFSASCSNFVYWEQTIRRTKNPATRENLGRALPEIGRRSFSRVACGYSRRTKAKDRRWYDAHFIMGRSQGTPLEVRRTTTPRSGTTCSFPTPGCPRRRSVNSKSTWPR